MEKLAKLEAPGYASEGEGSVNPAGIYIMKYDSGHVCV